MTKTNITNIFSVIALIHVFGVLSLNNAQAACNDYQDKKTCIANKKCTWEAAPVPECIAGANATANCYGLDKKSCLANKSKGCSWYVGCRNK